MDSNHKSSDPMTFGRACDATVDQLVEEAILRAYEDVTRPTAEKHSMPELSPPSIADFTIAAGIDVVNSVVDSWVFYPRWKYCIDYLRDERDDYRIRHVFQVQFSIPTNSQPIPKAVAHVFFHIDLHVGNPQYAPVQVSYVVENSQFEHVAGKSRFQEKWIVDVVNYKLKLWREMYF